MNSKKNIPNIPDAAAICVTLDILMGQEGAGAFGLNTGCIVKLISGEEIRDCFVELYGFGGVVIIHGIDGPEDKNGWSEWKEKQTLFIPYGQIKSIESDMAPTK